MPGVASTTVMVPIALVVTAVGRGERTWYRPSMYMGARDLVASPTVRFAPGFPVCSVTWTSTVYEVKGRDLAMDAALLTSTSCTVQPTQLSAALVSFCSFPSAATNMVFPPSLRLT